MLSPFPQLETSADSEYSLTTKHTSRLILTPRIAAVSTRLFADQATYGNMAKISDTIKTDHRELEGWYDKIINPANEDEQVRAQNQFVWELARHSIGEEIVVYPALEKHLENGKKLADRDRQEHQVVSSTHRDNNPIDACMLTHTYHRSKNSSSNSKA